MDRGAGEDRPLVRQMAGELRYALSLRPLPPRVAAFQWRARRVAWANREHFSLTSATRPRDLAQLLELAHGRRRVVALGTGMGWTAISLALEDRERRVTTFDPSSYAERRRYLPLVAPRVLERIQFIAEPGSLGPQDRDPVDMLYIDSSHEREQTLAELRAWWTALRPGAVVIFDDYTHPDFPGVREAVEEFGLQGVQRGTLFVHAVGAGQSPAGQGLPAAAPLNAPRRS
jgi:SAM-dependent methyltransferase